MLSEYFHISLILLTFRVNHSIPHMMLLEQLISYGFDQNTTTSIICTTSLIRSSVLEVKSTEDYITTHMYIQYKKLSKSFFIMLRMNEPLQIDIGAINLKCLTLHLVLYDEKTSNVWIRHVHRKIHLKLTHFLRTQAEDYWQQSYRTIYNPHQSYLILLPLFRDNSKHRSWHTNFRNTEYSSIKPVNQSNNNRKRELHSFLSILFIFQRFRRQISFEW